MRHRPLFSAVVVAALAVPVTGRAVIPDNVPDVPVFGQQVPRGLGLITSALDPVAATPKVIDGSIEDWRGVPSRFGGTAYYSNGEYVYQDYLNDNWGADDGADLQRQQVTGTLRDAEPRTYRLEAVSQLEGEQDPLGYGCLEDVGLADTIKPVCGDGNYGNVRDTNIRRETDIEEVHVAADATTVTILVRTTTAIDPGRTGILAIFGDDTPPGEQNPTAAGITTDSKTWLLAAGSSALATSNLSDVEVASSVGGAPNSPTEYDNAVEISVPRNQVELEGSIQLALGTCYIEASACKSVKTGDAKGDLLNVAFRPKEPARIWMDSEQSFAIHDGNIDGYMASIDLAKLDAGANEAFDVRPGYYERIYATDSMVNNEAQNSGSYFQGRFQQYGIYFPSNYRGADSGPYPTTWWMHYRGGHAHDAAAWVPGLIREFGEQKGNIVITPSARGTSTWYVGRGMEDFLDVWDDSIGSFPIDQNRVVMSGYSMGGFASWLLPTLMPDRFAAANPQEGPPTQGLLVEGTPAVGPIGEQSFVTQAQNGGDVEAENTFNILENARNVAYCIYAGNTDELVWVTGQLGMHAKLTALDYDNRLYQIDGGEHYASAILDHWTEAADYVNRFTRDPNPPRVTYRTWPAIEHAVSTISTNNQDLGYRFNSAYWVSDLEVRDVSISGGKPDPGDFGTIDATTGGRGAATRLGIPEAGIGVQGSAYQMTGWGHVVTGQVAPTNTFTATLTNLSQARLDVARMGLSTGERIEGTVTTDGPTELLLSGAWSNAPFVGYDHPGVTFGLTGGTLTIRFAVAGTYTITIG